MCCGEEIALTDHPRQLLTMPLCMQTVLRLIKDPTRSTFHDLSGDFLTAMGRKTVKNNGIGCRVIHQVLVHAEVGKRLFSLLLFLLLAHRSPNIGIHSLGITDRSVGI